MRLLAQHDQAAAVGTFSAVYTACYVLSKCNPSQLGVVLLVTAFAAPAFTQATAQPGDSALQVLAHPNSAQAAFLSSNPGWQEASALAGVLTFQDAKSVKRAALIGNVTHQDSTSGAWVPNDAVLSSTANGWRLDGTGYAVFVRQSGAQHVVTQTYNDYATKHASSLNFTTPKLTYATGLTFGFAQDGLNWNLIFTASGFFQIRPTVAKRIGNAIHSFPVSSSEALVVNSEGQLVGDEHVGLTRAVMIPRYGKPIPCSPWSYTKGVASFNCDDSALKDNQLPYVIDPQSQTITNNGTFNIDNWNDGQGNSGSDNATVGFSLTALPSDALIIGLALSFNVQSQNMDGNDSAASQIATGPPYAPAASVPGYSGSVSTTVSYELYVNVSNSDSSWSDSATINDAQLTVSYVGFSPGPGTYSAPAQVYIGFPYPYYFNVDTNVPVSWTGTLYFGGTGSSGSGTEADGFEFITLTPPTSGTTTVTASAWSPLGGSTPYSVAFGNYTVQNSVATPSFSPVAGSYTSAQSVSLSTSTTGATIRYTTDGSAPTETHGTIYTTSFTVSSTATIKAIGYQAGWTPSAVASAAYTISPVLSSVAVNPSTVISTNAATVTVILSGQAPSGGALVNLTSTNSSAFNPPANITVGAGQTTGSVTVTAGTVSASTNATVTGNYGGAQTSSVTVLPLPSVSGVSISPSSIGGGSSATITVTLSSAAPSSGAVVALGSTQILRCSTRRRASP